MEFNTEIRRKQLENLDQFISSAKDRVDSILDYLGWNAQKIAESQKEMVKCMINPSHRIPASSAASHMQNCAWRKESYDDNDLPLSEPNPVAGSTIIIDDVTKVNVLNSALTVNPHMKTGWRSSEPVPKTSNRLVSTFTSDERVALYDYAVSATKGPPAVPEFNIEPKIEEKYNLTPREIEALERDAKRRRIKYKTSVHTKNKSATEVLREVIDGQMEQYEEWLKEKSDTNTQKCDKNDSSNDLASPRSSRSQNSYRSEESRSKTRRSRSRSRSLSKKRDKYSRYERKEYFSKRKYEERDNDKRKYESRDSRKYRSKRSHSTTKADY